MKSKPQIGIIFNEIGAGKAQLDFLTPGSEYQWPKPEETELSQCGSDSQFLCDLGHPSRSEARVSP